MISADSQASGLIRVAWPLSRCIPPRPASGPVSRTPANTPTTLATAATTSASASTGRISCHLVAPRARSSADSSSRILASSRAASTSAAAATSSNASAPMVNSDLASVIVLAMPARTCGRRLVTCSPDGRTNVVRLVSAWLVFGASTPMFPWARAAACGSTNHEPWLAARPLRNAAGFTTAGPYTTREPGGPCPGRALTTNPETPTRSIAQYGAAGFLTRNTPVTRNPAAARPERVAVFSTEPGTACSRRATATGTATGSGSPRCAGPGQVPAVSTVWARIPSSAAGWSCHSIGCGVFGTGLASARTARGGESGIGFAHTALCIW